MENFQRIKTLDITPSKHIVKIEGQNEQGKSSAINSIAAAIGGPKLTPKKPLRDGEKKGFVKMDLGELTIERRYTASGSKLIVTNEVGDKVTKSPQALLTDLYNSLTLDPLEFQLMDDKKKIATLKDLLGLDFTDLDDKRADVFERRTNAKRKLGDLESRYKAITVNEETPDDEIIVSDLMVQLNDSMRINSKFTTMETNKTEVSGKLNLVTSKIEGLLQEKTELEGKLTEINNYFAEAKQVDVKPIQEKISNAERLNGYLKDKQAKEELKLRVQKGQLIVDGMTAGLVSIDDEKKKQLSEANFPFPGLTFDEDGIMVNNIPFSQLSHAEGLKVSVSMAMALNPALRVILIKDGSLLDDNSMKIISDLAEENDFQVWIEIVANKFEPGSSGIYIEDGAEVTDIKQENVA